MITARLIPKLHASLVFLALASTLHAQSSLRTVTGTVSDPSREPIRGAVVELENPASHQIISFITPADGHYIFNHIDSHTDFRIWATFRGHKSTIHTISMFDDHLDKVIAIVCHTE